MMYCQPRATFYVQLEDDILARPNYVGVMKKFALEKIAQRSPWFVIEFSQLGFIGKNIGSLCFFSASFTSLVQPSEEVTSRGNNQTVVYQTLRSPSLMPLNSRREVSGSRLKGSLAERQLNKPRAPNRG